MRGCFISFSPIWQVVTGQLCGRCKQKEDDSREKQLPFIAENPLTSNCHFWLNVVVCREIGVQSVFDGSKHKKDSATSMKVFGQLAIFNRDLKVSEELSENELTEAKELFSDLGTFIYYVPIT